MPEVIVRKRLGRRSGDFRYRMRRWIYHNRPQIAVVVAVGLMSMIGIAVLFGAGPVNQAIGDYYGAHEHDLDVFK